MFRPLRRLDRETERPHVGAPGRLGGDHGALGEDVGADSRAGVGRARTARLGRERQRRTGHPPHRDGPRVVTHRRGGGRSVRVDLNHAAPRRVRQGHRLVDADAQARLRHLRRLGEHDGGHQGCGALDVAPAAALAAHRADAAATAGFAAHRADGPAGLAAHRADGPAGLAAHRADAAAGPAPHRADAAARAAAGRYEGSPFDETVTPVVPAGAGRLVVGRNVGTTQEPEQTGHGSAGPGSTGRTGEGTNGADAMFRWGDAHGPPMVAPGVRLPILSPLW
jgi:hypothetical protein